MTMPIAYYPSGAAIPQYGPTTDDEMIVDALEWAHGVLFERDKSNAAIHCTAVRLSDVTIKVGTALSIARLRITAPKEWRDPDEQQP